MCMRSNDIYQEIEYEERYSKMIEQDLAPRLLISYAGKKTYLYLNVLLICV